MSQTLQTPEVCTWETPPRGGRKVIRGLCLQDPHTESGHPVVGLPEHGCTCAAPPGGRWRVVVFLPFEGPPHRKELPIVSGFMVYGKQSWDPTPGLLTVVGSPFPMLGKSASSGTPILSVTLGILRPHCSKILPALPPEHLSGMDVSYWTIFLKVPIFPSGAISLSASQLRQALPSPRIIFQYIPLDSLLHTSYFAKSGHFSVCRILVILFLHLLLESQLLRMIW